MARFNLKMVFAIGLCILCTGMVTAGQNNNSQSVCDASGLIGSAYATCHVYCDALDCDGQDDPKQGAACDRAYDRFLDLTGRTPPCEVTCPCASGWLHPDFVQGNSGTAECYIERGDDRGMWDLRVEAELDENGFAPVSAAGFDFSDDSQEGSRRFGCFSERYPDDSFVPTEDSGNFEMTSTFREDAAGVAQQFSDMARSCRDVFEKIVEDVGAECVVNDHRTE